MARGRLAQAGRQRAACWRGGTSHPIGSPVLQAWCGARFGVWRACTRASPAVGQVLLSQAISACDPAALTAACAPADRSRLSPPKNAGSHGAARVLVRRVDKLHPRGAVPGEPAAPRSRARAAIAYRCAHPRRALGPQKLGMFHLRDLDSTGGPVKDLTVIVTGPTA